MFVTLRLTTLSCMLLTMAADGAFFRDKNHLDHLDHISKVRRLIDEDVKKMNLSTSCDPEDDQCRSMRIKKPFKKLPITSNHLSSFASPLTSVVDSHPSTDDTSPFDDPVFGSFKSHDPMMFVNTAVMDINDMTPVADDLDKLSYESTHDYLDDSVTEDGEGPDDDDEHGHDNSVGLEAESETEKSSDLTDSYTDYDDYIDLEDFREMLFTPSPIAGETAIDKANDGKQLLVGMNGKQKRQLLAIGLCAIIATGCLMSLLVAFYLQRRSNYRIDEKLNWTSEDAIVATAPPSSSSSNPRRLCAV